MAALKPLRASTPLEHALAMPEARGHEGLIRAVLDACPNTSLFKLQEMIAARDARRTARRRRAANIPCDTVITEAAP